MSKESARFIVESIDGKHDAADVKQELDTLHGVSSVSINTQDNRVAVDYDSSGVSYDIIENRLNKIGFEITADASRISTR